MEKIAVMIAEKMIKNGVIEYDEKEIYVYALQVNLEKLIGYIVLFIVAILTSDFLGIMLFSFVFINLRKYSSGYHCKTTLGCFVLTLCTMLSVAAIVNSGWLNDEYFYIVTITSAIMIFLIGAVNNDQINWDESQFAYAKKKTRQHVLFDVNLVCLLKLVDSLSKVGWYASLAIEAVSLGLIVAWVERRKNGFKEST